MSRTLAALAVVLVVTGCGSTTPAKPKADTIRPEGKIVQQRYADCLTKLDAKLDADGPRWVSFDTKGGGYLVIGVAKVNGKYVTAPKDDRAAALLATVGC